MNAAPLAQQADEQPVEAGFELFDGQDNFFQNIELPAVSVPKEPVSGQRSGPPVVNNSVSWSQSNNFMRPPLPVLNNCSNVTINFNSYFNH